MKQRIAFLILRLGLGTVFLLFGIGKFQNDAWAQTIRNMDFFLKFPWDVGISLFLIGSLEIITGAALIIGLFTRFFAGLAVLQLIAILILLQFQELRDVGLLAGAIYLALSKEVSWGIDWLRDKRKERL